MISELGFIVSFVWFRAIYCFLNQPCEPFLELPVHPNKLDQSVSQKKSKPPIIFINAYEKSHFISDIPVERSSLIIFTRREG